ncbi:hypothetical protein [Longimicrobium terrae]|uniref:Uncharacterized protein n=1 Tax=Longimicrobium terrae TaxID=1639882 RepID=A0A841H0A0_9BACT|nr:hypothetical protein [Longimicrobium terrae]MBB4636942.1 hypothetical protein [Longimicrobium terrae]MBB6071450.1 hypothetical protein [Longimicrobium terrae]NNC31332.1 hypothetical protein [Longimicrobium terrae]
MIDRSRVWPLVMLCLPAYVVAAGWLSVEKREVGNWGLSLSFYARDRRDFDQILAVIYSVRFALPDSGGSTHSELLR